MHGIRTKANLASLICTAHMLIRLIAGLRQVPSDKASESHYPRFSSANSNPKFPEREKFRVRLLLWASPSPNDVN
jgi:hypothetical protein